MGESYDSIGSRVIRHFRHYISGDSHMWLKGDYHDPSMCSTPLPAIEGTKGAHGDKITVVPVDKSEPLEIENRQAKNSAEVDHMHRCSGFTDMQSNTQDTDGELDSGSAIQSDSVKSSKIDLRHEISGVDTESDKLKKIDFNFVSNKQQPDKVKNKFDNNNSEDKYDETDKLLAANGEIIDITPIIGNLQKRRANNDRGFDPEEDFRPVNKKVKFSPRKQDGRTKAQNGRLRGENVKRNLGTVMNCRSVYYRSQSIEEESC